jgi:5-methylcytosine-specific restriction endonuclease McrA
MKPARKQPPIKSKITSALRQVWRWSPERRAALERARVQRGVYECELCGHRSGPKGVQVDHIVPCRLSDDPSWDGFIARLFCGTEGLRVICKGCHEAETAKQAKARSEAKRMAKKGAC